YLFDSILLFFFFFQAADGIRAFHVTGVQTCALPISYLNGRFAALQVKGFQGSDIKSNNSVASCVKHFAAYGAAEAGKDYNTVDKIGRASCRERVKNQGLEVRLKRR